MPEILVHKILLTVFDIDYGNNKDVSIYWFYLRKVPWKDGENLRGSSRLILHENTPLILSPDIYFLFLVQVGQKESPSESNVYNLCNVGSLKIR